jgi:hypothetical protein
MTPIDPRGPWTREKDEAWLAYAPVLVGTRTMPDECLACAGRAIGHLTNCRQIGARA